MKRRLADAWRKDPDRQWRITIRSTTIGSIE